MEEIGVNKAFSVTLKCMVGYNHETDQNRECILPKNHDYALVQNLHCLFTHSFILPVNLKYSLQSAVNLAIISLLGASKSMEGQWF